MRVVGERVEKVVSQLHKEKEGRAAVLYIPLSLQAAELGSTGHASPPAWKFPISGSGQTQPGRRGRRVQERRYRGESHNQRGRQEQRERLLDKESPK